MSLSPVCVCVLKAALSHFLDRGQLGISVPVDLCSMVFSVVVFVCYDLWSSFVFLTNSILPLIYRKCMFGRIVCVFLTTCVCVSEGLLVEADRLAQERLCVQRQAEKDRSSLSLRLRALETELEDQENQGLTAEQQHRAQSEDLLQRVQALEKQLKHDRQFIDVSVTL